MAQLKVFHRNQGKLEQVSTIDLYPSKDYCIGRAEDCDIVIPARSKISRRHLKLSYVGGAKPYWQVKLLSKNGDLVWHGARVPAIDLKSPEQFVTHQYEFHFFPDVSERQVALSSGLDLADQTPTFKGAEPQYTAVLVLKSGPRLPSYSYKLESAESWVIGQSSSCSVVLAQPEFSAEHFEIIRRQDSFFIRDLKSQFGTILNGRQLLAHDLQPIRSSDRIEVGPYHFKFELHDKNFEKKLIEALPYAQETRRTLEQGLADWQRSSAPSSPANGSNWVQFLIVAIVLVAGLAYFIGPSQSANSRVAREPAEAKKMVTAFDKLKPDQQIFVKQSHRLAKELLMQGRYEMARQEIIKIHQFVSVYEDSQEIESTAVQGIELQREKALLETKERERHEIEMKIQKQLRICKARINDSVTSVVMDQCLLTIIQFNPDHPGIQALRAQVDQIESNRQIRLAQKEDYQRRVQRQKKLYSLAANIQKRGVPRAAISAYETVVRSPLPDPTGLKLKAKREIASIQKQMAVDQAKHEGIADENQKKGDLKGAIIALKKAVAINPDNEVTKGKMSSLLAELRKSMQVIYQESILEESVGEVENAKVKWKKIREQSLPEEEYYKKATTKLKKYGVGV